jgi:hypothetical protein
MSHPFSLRAFGLLFLWSTGAQAASVSYQTIADTSAIVTGIRSDSSTTDSVVMTANYTTGGVQYAGLYEGSLQAATAAGAVWHKLTPVIGNQTVTAATFYGPNTSLFNPSLGAGDVVAVGSYKYDHPLDPLASAADHGLLYVGPLDGSGTWTQIDATPLVPQGESLKDTIAHSNMGDLVVGNYDTDLVTGRAFIYNRTSNTWVNLNPGGTQSVTAYGIWQNGGSNSTSYTIAGGQGNLGAGVVDQSYLVDYDSVTHALTHYRVYRYNDQPSSAFLSHFDGITLRSDGTGYNLTGFVTTGGTVKGFFATVRRNTDGSFGDATWADVFYPGGALTTGNTIVDNKVLGIFINGGTTSYLATVGSIDSSVGITVKNNGNTRSTFTITNNSSATTTFTLGVQRKVTNSYNGPTPTTPGTPRFTFSYTLNGASQTKAIEGGTATVTLDPGVTATVVQKVKLKGKLAFKRTIKTTLYATSTRDTSVTANATGKLVLKAN